MLNDRHSISDISSSVPVPTGPSEFRNPGSLQLTNAIVTMSWICIYGAVCRERCCGREGNRNQGRKLKNSKYYLVLRKNKQRGFVVRVE